MARRVFLHVGTMKSGTSFLQSLWWRHHDILAERGLLLPGSRLADHFVSASLVCRREQILAELTPAEHETWRDLTAEVGRWAGDALVSHELFSPATPEQASQALRLLEKHADEVHVVVTARDLARQLPSHWQEQVKHHSDATLVDYWEHVRRHDPDDPFWTFHDVPALADRWGQGLPPERVHVVVNPPGAPRDWLWRHTADLMGVDVGGLDLEARNPNESLGIAEIEVMRRVQGALPAEEKQLEMSRLTKGFLTRDVLHPSGPGDRFVPPAQVHGWAVERGTLMAEQLRDRGHDVVGDLDDLVPSAAAPRGRVPDDVTADEVADVAVAALARMVVHDRHQRARIEELQAQRRRLRRRLDAAAPGPGTRSTLAGALRRISRRR
ncbi:hypothetical protein [Nocardioides euryhalodurans]|uniref:Sulfotransferase family protein n=1 Tax=Nocardioides euryhalodurans TaxID=2518370 RepID=A0A4P7GJJ6_9ACTN|nr:hypothetical protein [Nocardioides euryhalodurans]QBR91939.1 hypothetical protein EXE57_06350 [Nocardioides euryhalodurans]